MHYICTITMQGNPRDATDVSLAVCSADGEHEVSYG